MRACVRVCCVRVRVSVCVCCGCSVFFHTSSLHYSSTTFPAITVIRIIVIIAAPFYLLRSRTSVRWPRGEFAVYSCRDARLSYFWPLSRGEAPQLGLEVTTFNLPRDGFLDKDCQCSWGEKRLLDIKTLFSHIVLTLESVDPHLLIFVTSNRTTNPAGTPTWCKAAFFFAAFLGWNLHYIRWKPGGGSTRFGFFCCKTQNLKWRLQFESFHLSLFKGSTLNKATLTGLLVIISRF